MKNRSLFTLRRRVLRNPQYKASLCHWLSEWAPSDQNGTPLPTETKGFTLGAPFTFLIGTRASRATCIHHHKAHIMCPPLGVVELPHACHFSEVCFEALCDDVKTVTDLFSPPRYIYYNRTFPMMHQCLLHLVPKHYRGTHLLLNSVQLF